jgi:hypothetical protein
LKQQHIRIPGLQHLLNRMELFAERALERDELRATLQHAQSRSYSTWRDGYFEPNDPALALSYVILELAAWLLIEPEHVNDPYYYWRNEYEMPNGWREAEHYPYPIQIATMVADAFDSDVEKSEGWSYERDQQLLLIRDIFGNPFRPVTLDPRWLTSTVLDLARTIYDERVYERMPILADALMDAGCDSEEIINHCRGEGPHVRGCYVVDLILSKK